MPSPLRTIFFDLDNTLLDRDVAFAAWAEIWLDAHGGRLAAAERAAMLERLRLLDGRARTERSEFFPRVAALFECSAEDVRTSFFAHVPKLVQLQPGAEAMLARLQTRYRIAAVTNGSTQSQRTKMAAVGLTLHAFVSGEFGADKPAPLIFETALRWAECAPHEALFVGDDPIRDIEGAARMGIRTCWVSNGEAWPEPLARPDWTVHTVAQLEEFLP